MRRRWIRKRQYHPFLDTKARVKKEFDLLKSSVSKKLEQDHSKDEDAAQNPTSISLKPKKNSQNVQSIDETNPSKKLDSKGNAANAKPDQTTNQCKKDGFVRELVMI